MSTVSPGLVFHLEYSYVKQGKLKDAYALLVSGIKNLLQHDQQKSALDLVHRLVELDYDRDSIRGTWTSWV